MQKTLHGFFAFNSFIPFHPLTNYSLRETFDGVYLDLSKQSGKCRFAESGLGWKPSGGGDTFTLDKAEVLSAQWGKAAKGYEVKIHSRNTGVIQLDGFHEDVRRRVTNLVPC